MADEEPESFTSKLLCQTPLQLRVLGGRVFAQNAQLEDLDRCTIELKCEWSSGLLSLFDLRVAIGDEKHKPFKWDDDGVQVVDEDAEEVTGWSLHDCAIVVSIYRAEDGWLAENAGRTKETQILGRFDYNPPLQTGDGVVNDKRPTAFAWIALGQENFRAVRDRLLASEPPDFDLGVTVEFPVESVKPGWIGKDVTWDGEGPLPVTSATVVWKRGNWDPKSDRERNLFGPSPPKEYVPPREHVELLGAVNELQAKLAKLEVPVWIAAIAAALMLLFRR